MNVNSEKFYDKIAFIYPLIDVFLKPQKRKLFNKINTLPNGNLLEIGIGNGSHLEYYKTHRVTGIDNSKKMLQVAGKYHHKNIDLIHMNGETLLFKSKTFDYIVLSHVITVVQNPEKLLYEIHRVLKPNGQVFILNHFTPDNYLKYLDILFEKASRVFYFKSILNINNLKSIKKFNLVNQINVGPFSYF